MRDPYVEKVSIGVQHAIGQNASLASDYVPCSRSRSSAPASGRRSVGRPLTAVLGARVEF
jgi:hypothetical protein